MRWSQTLCRQAGLRSANAGATTRLVQPQAWPSPHAPSQLHAPAQHHPPCLRSTWTRSTTRWKACWAWCDGREVASTKPAFALPVDQRPSSCVACMLCHMRSRAPLMHKVLLMRRPNAAASQLARHRSCCNNLMSTLTSLPAAFASSALGREWLRLKLQVCIQLGRPLRCHPPLAVSTGSWAAVRSQIIAVRKWS